MSRYVHLGHTFKSPDWYPRFNGMPAERLADLKSTKVVSIRKRLDSTSHDDAVVERICKDMPSVDALLSIGLVCQNSVLLYQFDPCF